MTQQDYNNENNSGSPSSIGSSIAGFNGIYFSLPPFIYRAFIALILLPWGLQAAELIPLGSLFEGGSSSAVDVSDDGKVVVGTADPTSGPDDREAYRWTADSGMVGLGDFPGGWSRSRAVGLSTDGNMVAGDSSGDPVYHAFRWTSADDKVVLGDVPGGGTESFAEGISADGQVIVGQASGETMEAFRWTEAGGMEVLGDLPLKYTKSMAQGVSGDGSVVVGWAGTASGWEAFRWTGAGGMVGLGYLPGGEETSQATGASGDGSVVVGHASNGINREAFRWTSSGGMVGLGNLPGGVESDATAVSANGNIVVGNSRISILTSASSAQAENSRNAKVVNSQNDFGGNEFFIWTQAKGMERLQDVLLANGTTGMDGWGPFVVGGISDNGQWVVGTGINPSGESEAFLVRLPTGMGQSFVINAGLNDAWYNPETDGQGFFITVFPELGFVTLAWFTYDTELPPEDATSNLGDPGHRWITAVGPIDGNQVLMNVEMTSGGIFDAPSTITRTDPPGSDGTILLTFDSCESGTIEYDILSINRIGIVPIQRVAGDNILLCEALSSE